MHFLYHQAGSRGVCLLEHEIEILKIINHPNLIKLYEVYETRQQVFLVMELCEKGQLAQMLKKKNNLEEREIRDVIKQLACALTYLHKMELNDFGLAIKIGGVTADHMLHDFCGTPVYMGRKCIQGMLEVNPALRLSANEISNSYWITGKTINSENVNVLEMMKQYKEDQMEDKDSIKIDNDNTSKDVKKEKEPSSALEQCSFLKKKKIFKRRTSSRDVF
ncbi:serine/threonine-protein kinase 33-like [Octopus sinensis]|uniref:Serine/threonine-protein kinase 33-like n=1 Tax=Octopus sinensis TaxID=2607531 RepID=A0A7E6EM44_9MOLL|nr:serine/threonine-protein kinase 33-like [Octopus sinensis]